MIRLVSALAGARKISVEPVYVINPEDLTLAGIFEGRVDEFRRAVEEQVYTQLKGAKLPDCSRPPFFSRLRYPPAGRAGAAFLCEETGAELIAVGTHSRKGYEASRARQLCRDPSLHSRNHRFSS